jgi:phospholipid-translocating ATPase
MRKLHMGTMSYGWDSMDEVAHQLASAFGSEAAPGKPYIGCLPDNCLPCYSGTEHVRRQSSITGGMAPASRGRRDISSRLKDAILALATCHNVSIDRIEKPNYC